MWLRPQQVLAWPRTAQRRPAIGLSTPQPPLTALWHGALLPQNWPHHDPLSCRTGCTTPPPDGTVLPPLQDWLYHTPF
jgi:hypothetical protein